MIFHIYVFMILMYHNYMRCNDFFLCGIDNEALHLQGLMNHTGSNIDGLLQEKYNSSALAMELRLSWNNPSI